jgi:hypothetical protein
MRGKLHNPAEVIWVPVMTFRHSLQHLKGSVFDKNVSDEISLWCSAYPKASVFSAFHTKHNNYESVRGIARSIHSHTQLISWEYYMNMWE